MNEWSFLNYAVEIKSQNLDHCKRGSEKGKARSSVWEESDQGFGGTHYTAADLIRKAFGLSPCTRAGGSDHHWNDI